MQNSSVIFLISLALYGGAIVLHMRSILSKSQDTRSSGLFALVLGLVVLTVGMVTRDIELHHSSLTNLSGSLTFTAWAISLIYVGAARRSHSSVVGTLVSALSFAAMLAAFLLSKATTGYLPPVLRSNWSIVHITSCLLGYASLILAFVAAVAYASQERMLKTKRISVFQRHMSPLEVTDNLAYSMVAFGFPMLTLGIVTGALWAQTALGRLWQWDPKETAALITWLVYAAYLHMRVVRGWRGKWSNRLLIIGFVCILMTYFGINLLQSYHTCGW